MRIIFFKNVNLYFNFNIITYLEQRYKRNINNKHTLCSTSASHLVTSHCYFVNLFIQSLLYFYLKIIIDLLITNTKIIFTCVQICAPNTMFYL